jgi:putative colanic acid biosynthesis glycosyltransferase
MNSDPAIRFSIVTVVLNDKAGFRKTRESVEAQTFPGFEWVIVDGGSTDGTLEDLREIGRANCRWFSEPDKGIYDGMNKGLALATGEYVVFMNSDDRFAGRDVLARIDALLAETEMEWDLVFGDAYQESETGCLLLKKARTVAAIKYGMFTHHQAIVYRRQAIENMRYDLNFAIAGDYHLTSRLLVHGGRSLRAQFPICISSLAGVSEKKAEVGRREALAIQKHVLHLGPLRLAFNHAAFLASNLMRTHMRGLYDRIRFRRATPLHEIR